MVTRDALKNARTVLRHAADLADLVLASKKAPVTGTFPAASTIKSSHLVHRLCAQQAYNG